MSMMPIVFLDTETTGLADTAEVWEIGMIVRGHVKPAYDGEWLWQVKPRTMGFAEPMGLSIGRFYERYALEGRAALCMASPINGMVGTSLDASTGSSHEQVARWVSLLTAGATWVGAVPSFDERMLSAFVEGNGWKLAHHYHLIDVEPLAAGFIAGYNKARVYEDGALAQGIQGFDPSMLPWKSKELTAAIGVAGPVADEHTALGDARWAMAVYDKVFGTA